MPFIRGRYYVNPIAGNAIEAAREAEESADASQDGHDDHSNEADSVSSTKPVRRIDIEVTELIPSHTGRATKGFVACLHREETAVLAAGSADAAVEKRVFYDPGQLADFVKNKLANHGTCR